MYTKHEEENSREKQIKCPTTPEELTLALTYYCLKYLSNVGECDAHYMHVLSALSSNPSVAGGPVEKPNPTTVLHLKSQLAFIIDVYRGKNRETEYVDEIRGALVLAQAEMFRRMVVPFLENEKEKNGDIYPTVDRDPASEAKEAKEAKETEKTDKPVEKDKDVDEAVNLGKEA